MTHLFLLVHMMPFPDIPPLCVYPRIYPPCAGFARRDAWSRVPIPKDVKALDIAGYAPIILPQAASRKPQAASRKPQAASRKPQAASRKPQ
ncbi:MAG: hypothetical protein LBF50_09570, partial [Azoarcus sp.]|nr:hypothetical protein [Azoarcus sp.]